MSDLRLSLRQLTYFIKVAEHGSINRAAEELRISPSAVSEMINGLETQFGAALMLRRKGKGVLLTSLGAEVLPDIRALLAGASDLQSTLHGSRSELSGRLVIGCMTTLSPFLLPGLITEFRNLHPAVDIQFVEGSQVQLQKHLQDGRCELAILYDDDDLAPNFVREVLYKTPPKIVLPANHRLARSTTVNLRDLQGEPFIMIDLPPSRENVKAIFKTAGVTPNIRYVTSSIELVRAFVARGFGYSILVQRPANDISYEGFPIAVRPIKKHHFEIRVVLCRAAGRPSGRVQAFSEMCHRLLDNAGPSCWASKQEHAVVRCRKGQKKRWRRTIG
ncbi:LysR family transcriptional regulator [Pseudorhodoplanes sp.]|uniref:LysR family transcriptional regulator n=1 Tax=Pseudorhodoplanes sp. TaxID=1934341 RepID=UPI003D12731D